MSEKPILPPIPCIGDSVIRKDNMKEIKLTIFECLNCGKKTERSFREGDYVYQKFSGESCSRCSKTQFIINEIYAEFKKLL